MKIAITGHTQGIGQALYQGWTKQGHDVGGFSRSNGYDISTDRGIDQIVSESIDCDVFVNNAYDASKKDSLAGFAQTVLLYKLWTAWQGQDRTIIVVGSRMVDAVQPRVYPYLAHKTALDTAVHQLRLVQQTSPKILYVKPGLVDTGMVASVTGHAKLDPQEIFDACDWALNTPSQILDLGIGSLGI